MCGKWPFLWATIDAERQRDWSEQAMHWVDLLIIGILAWFTFRAYSNGLIREVVGLLSLIVGVIVAGAFYRELSADTDFLLENERLRNLASFAALFAGIWILGFIAANVLRRVASLFLLGPFDKLGGGAFGFVKALILVQVALIAIAVFPPGASVAGAVEDSALAEFFLDEVPVVEIALPQEFDHAFDQLKDWQASSIASAREQLGS
jgi:membrane protein required for colicin V production